MSENELTFYTNPQSRGRIVRWMLEEVGAPYRTEVVEFGQPMKAEEYRAINPMGKVPAVVHKGSVVTEAAAICAYLADAFPDAGLAPPPSARAAYYRWLFFAAGPVEASVTNKALQVRIPDEKQGMVGYGNPDLVIQTLAAAVADRPYIAGDSFSAADVYLGAQIGWGMQFGTMPKEPSFEKYWKGLSERPACKRAAELDDQLLK